MANPQRDTEVSPVPGVGHVGYMHGVAGWVCERCGSKIGQRDLHDAFHDQIERLGKLGPSTDKPLHGENR
jgi:hypothetical protein